MVELYKNLREMKVILYGNSESEPVAEACAQLTQEFFIENTLRLLIKGLPKLNLEARKDATQVVANLQRQQVHSRLIACDYLEANIELMDILAITPWKGLSSTLSILCRSLRRMKASDLSTRLGNVFTIGKGSKPWVSLPKGKGIKLTIIEKARKRLAAQATA